MLPGFRFLFAAIVLAMSVMIFGLGAAALLRAAHEQFASIPSRRALPGPVFGQQQETLALLRFEPSAIDQAPDQDATVVEKPVAAALLAGTEKLAALNAEDSTPSPTAAPDMPTFEAMPPGEDVSAQVGAPALPEETKVAAIPDVASENESALAAAEPQSPSASPEAGAAATRIATLGGPAVDVEATEEAKGADAKSNRRAIRKRLRAQRARERRKLAALHLAQQLAAQQAAAQQQANPFAPPAVTRASP